jgi:hypothetical protein
MLVTADFLKNPISFMRSIAILVPDQTGSGSGKFELEQYSKNDAILKRTSQSEYISGYNVIPSANKDNVFELPFPGQDKYYMFTTCMDGCQFIAYGIDSYHITVEHNNYIDNHSNYSVHLDSIKGKDYPYFFSISPGTENDIIQGKYNSAECINILGEFTNSMGWKFFIRDNLNKSIGNIYEVTVRGVNVIK